MSDRIRLRIIRHFQQTFRQLPQTPPKHCDPRRASPSPSPSPPPSPSPSHRRALSCALLSPCPARARPCQGPLSSKISLLDCDLTPPLPLRICHREVLALRCPPGPTLRRRDIHICTQRLFFSFFLSAWRLTPGAKACSDRPPCTVHAAARTSDPPSVCCTGMVGDVFIPVPPGPYPGAVQAVEDPPPQSRLWRQEAWTMDKSRSRCFLQSLGLWQGERKEFSRTK